MKILLILLLATTHALGHPYVDSLKRTKKTFALTKTSAPVKALHDGNIYRYISVMQLIEEIQTTHQISRSSLKILEQKQKAQPSFYSNSASVDSDASPPPEPEDETPLNAQELFNTANKLACLGDFDNSILAYKKCLAESASFTNKKQILQISLYLARILTFKNQLDEALNIYLSTIARAKGAKQQKYVGMAWLGVATVKGMQKKNAEAEKIFITRALPILYKVDKGLASICFSALATLYEKQRKYPQAKWFYVQAKTLAQKTNDGKKTLRAMIDLARVQGKSGDNEQALEGYKETQELAKKLKATANMAQIKTELAVLYKRVGKDLLAKNEETAFNQIKTELLR